MKTAVLLMTFNRPEHTARVLERIVAARPVRLYVFQDAPREGNAGDVQACARVRDLVEAGAREAGLPLRSAYAREHLGCGVGPARALTWFFREEAQGIVLEDDCLPHPHFFPYCEELLDRYARDTRVGLINATLYAEQERQWRISPSYGFSRYLVTGAWAGWRRTWEGFDLDLQGLNPRRFRRHLVQLLDNGAEADAWYFKLRDIQADRGLKHYWDYQLQILLFCKGLYTLHPRCNLVSNIGFDPLGTHTRHPVEGLGDRPVHPILPLRHPRRVKVDKALDARCFAKAKPCGGVRRHLRFLFHQLQRISYGRKGIGPQYLG